MEDPKYRLLIVDENQEQIDDFITFFEKSPEFTILQLNKLSSDDELFDFILDNDVDAIAFDYKLRENNDNFPKNGDAYLNVLLDTYENFPAFIITNNSLDAKKMHVDPFKVIGKDIINYNNDVEEEVLEADNLKENIKTLIDNYKASLTEFEEQLHLLIEKQSRGEQLTDDEIKAMVDLDTKLENSISKKSKIPKEWKTPVGIEAINDLVAKSDNILDRLKKLTNE